MYLLTNPLTNIAGIYQITIDRMAFDTGYDERTLLPMIARFAEHKKVFYFEDEWMILVNWTKHQKVSEKDNNRIGIDRILQALPQEVYEYAVESGYYYKYLHSSRSPLQAPYKPLTRVSDYLNPNLNLNLNINKEPSKYLPQAEHLAKRIIENDAGHFKNKNHSSILNKWADHFRLLCERDGRDIELIDKVIDWCQDSTFWKANILSADKLRKQFPTLLLQMNKGSPLPPDDGNFRKINF